MRDDPNGIDWQPTWKVYGYSSFEAYVESKAGASPCEHEWIDGPDPEHAEIQVCLYCGQQAGDWPQPEPPPYEADDENDIHPEEGTA
jgi:hypothetical protein